MYCVTRLFVRRDELFELALNGTLGFEDQAYVLLRHKINNMLRFSHKISPCLGVADRLLLAEDRHFDKMLEALDREWKDAVGAASQRGGADASSKSP